MRCYLCGDVTGKDRVIFCIKCIVVNNIPVVSKGMLMSVNLIFILKVPKAPSLCLVLLDVLNYFGLLFVVF